MAPIYQFELSKEQAEGFRNLGYNPVELNTKPEQIARLDRNSWIVVHKKIKDSKQFPVILLKSV